MALKKGMKFYTFLALIITSMMILSGITLVGNDDIKPQQAGDSSIEVRSNEQEQVTETMVEKDEDGNILSLSIPADNLNLRTTSTPDPSSTSDGTRGQWDQIIMQEDYESSTWWAKWNQLEDENSNSNGDWWGSDNDAPYVHGGLWSANCTVNYSGSPAGGAGIGYDNNMSAWMTYGPIDLSSTAGLSRCAKLTFWYWLDCQGNNNDFFFFGASNGDAPGGVMTFYPPVWTTQSITSGRIKKWRWVDYNLTDTNAIGQNLPGDPNVYIAFFFKSDASLCGLLPQGYKGAYVDDIKLEDYTNNAPNPPEFLNVSAPYGNIRRVVDHTPILNWTFVDPDTGIEEYPTGFHIQVGDDDDWITPEMAEKNQTYNGYLAPQWEYSSTNLLVDGQRYYFRVKARDADWVWSNWSQSFNFSMNDAPTAPTLTDPTTGVKWDGGLPESHWVNWTIATNNDDNPPPDDTITINITLSTDGGLTFDRNIILDETNDGDYLWSPIFNNVESNQCIIRVTAFDGFEITTADTPIMTIDSYSPVINDIYTSSTKPYFWEDPGMTSTGGTVWFNSLTGEGSGQVLTLTIDWSDASKVLANGATAFGDTPSDSDIDPVSLDYSVETNAGNFNGVTITVTDYFSRSDTATVDFKVDNVDPTVPISVVCHPDSYIEIGEADNDTEVYVTWTDGNDGAGCGISHSILYTTDIQAAVQNLSQGQGIWNSPIFDAKITVNVSMVDRVGNIGPVGSDDFIIDFTNPPTAVVYSDTHPDPAEYYSNKDPVINWTPPPDLSGINSYSYELDQVSDTDPPPTPTGEKSSVNYYTKDDGTWYFHVRALDNASHWGSSSHFKLNIDTTEPTIVKDYTDNSATTGETVHFEVEANDGFSGVGEVRLYWRYTGETDYRIVPVPQSGAEKYIVEFEVHDNSSANIEYYITVNDTAIPVNTAYTPDRFVKDFEEIAVSDNDLPIITEITGDTIGYTGEPTTIVVNTSDNVDVISAKIYVDTDKTGVTMFEAPNNMFTFDIDVPLNNLDDIEYYVKIWDAASNTERSPAHSPEIYIVTVLDNDAPIINDVTGDTVGSSGAELEIVVEAEDNYDDGKDLTATLFIGTETEINDDPAKMDFDHISGSKFRVTYNIPKFTSTDLKYYVTVTDTALNAVRNPITTEFTIYIPSITAPNGGEVWNGTQTITWTVKDISDQNTLVTLYYWDDSNNMWEDLAQGESDDGSYSWDTTQVKDGVNYKIKIVVRYTTTWIAVDESDYVFRVYNPDNPDLQVQYPIGGERLTGSTVIRWQATDDDNDEISVKIEYRMSSDNDNWSTIAIDNQNTGSFTWNTLTLADGEFYLRFTAIDKSAEQLFDVYETIDTIEIDNELSILVIAPKAGETWSGSKDILWQTPDSHGSTIYINLQYRKNTDPPNEWKDLTTEKLQNTGNYRWDTTSVPNGDYFIRIYGYITVGDERDGEAISQQFRVKNEDEEVGFFDTILSWLLILIIIIVIVCAVVFVVLRKKKREKELKKESRKLKTQDFVKPPDVPQGPQLYTIAPTAPPPLFPVEQQRYQPIAPPPPVPPPPQQPPKPQPKPPRTPPPPSSETTEPEDVDDQPEEDTPEPDETEISDDEEPEEQSDETPKTPKIKDPEQNVPKIKNS